MNGILETAWNSGWPLIIAGFVVIAATIIYQKNQDKIEKIKEKFTKKK